MILIFAAAVILAFTFPFRQCRIERDGDSVSPGWYRLVQYTGLLVTVVLVLTQMGTIVGFLSNLLSFTPNALAGSLGYALVLCVAFYYTHQLGLYTASLGQRKQVNQVFDKDSVVQSLVKDAEAGANEILIFRDRLEGRRSYTFDVDGYNHPSYSEYGCKELAGYVMRHTSTKYTKKVCHGLAGPQGPRISNTSGEGAQYRFSHVELKKCSEN